MNIYDALEANRITPAKMKNANKIETSEIKGNIETNQIASTPVPEIASNDSNSDSLGYFTPADQSKIKLAYLKNENKIKRSTEYKDFLVDQLDQQVNKIVAEIDSYDLPTFGVSDKQFKSMALLMANAEDKEAMREKLEPALLFSNAFEIPLATALENTESLSEIYGIGSNVDKGNLGQKVKGAWKVGSNVSKLSNVGNRISLITDRLNELSLIEETGDDSPFIDKAFTAFGQVLNREIGEAQSLKNKTAEELTIELEELKKEAEAINRDIMKNTNNIDNGMWTNLLLATAQSLPYMLETVAAGAEGALMMGAAIATLTATGLTAGTSLSASTGLASQSVGALMKGKSLVAAAASISSFQDVKKMMKGTKYLEYIENGVDHKTAKISSDIFGSFAASEEILFDALPMQFLGSLLGRKTGSVFLKNAIQRFGMSGKPAKALVAIAGAAESGLGEGFTEFSQYFTEAFADAMVYSKQETGSMLNLDLDNIINKKTIKEASEQFAMGFGIALFLGVPSTFYQVAMNINEYNQISKIMQTSESKVTAINEASKIAPETSRDVFEKFWDKTQEIKNKTIKKTSIKEPGNAKGEVSNSETPKNTPSVVDAEKLSYSDTTTRIKGNSSLLKTTTVRDSKGVEVGSIKKTEVGNTISINDVNIEEPKVMYKALKNIISNNVGKNILLNSKGDVVLEQIKQTLIEENPRGEEFGLSWYVSTDEELQLSKKIKDPYNMTDEQARVSAALITNLARHENLTTNQYWEKHFPNEIDTKTLDADATLGDKKGAIKFLDKERLQAVLYTSKNSNVSTFTHETFHLAVHQMANKGTLAQSIKNWVKTDEFKTFFDENRKLFGSINYDSVMKEADSFDVSDDATWSFNQDELSASLFEIWQADNTKIKDKEMSSIFAKISEWFKDIYGAVKGTVKINEDISNYFEQMYGKADEKTASNLETKVKEQTKLEKYNEAKYLQQQKISDIENKIKNAKGKKKHNLLLELRNLKKDLDDIRYQSDSPKNTDNLAEAELIREEYKNTEKWLKAPNGADTNLSEDLWVKVRTTAFKDWFGDWENDPENASKVVDENGEPLVVYHGSTHNFEIFKNKNADNDMGEGFYFSNSFDDVSANYEGEGPDLTNRISRLAEEIENNPEDYGAEELDIFEAESIAKSILVGDNEKIYETFLNITNPATIGKPYGFDTKNNKETTFSYVEEFNEEVDDYDINGSIFDMINELEIVLNNNEDGDIQAIREDIFDEFSANEEIPLGELIEILKQSEGLAYATDENGNLISNEIIRETLSRLGYNGIIDFTVNEKFGTEREYGEPMEGMDEKTFHTIAFESNQIKSVENNGAFSNEDDNILFQTMSKEEEPKKTGKGYKLFEMKDGKLYPLFIGAKKETEMGVWFKAENLPTKGFAKRPGWHIGSTTPDAPWLKSDNGTDIGTYKGKRSGSIRVWAEVEYPMDVDYQPQADKSPTKDLPNQIPEGGSYLFKEGQRGTWVVAGALKVNRILDNQEVDSILKEQGYDQAKNFEKYRKAIIKRKETLSAKKTEKLTQEQIEAGKKFNPKAEDVLYQTAYHGTAYYFNKFLTEHIGNGEGHQAFGWGLYFTQVKDVSKSYARNTFQDKIGNITKFTIDGRDVNELINESKTYSTTRYMYSNLTTEKHYLKTTKEEMIDLRVKKIGEIEKDIKELETYKDDENNIEDFALTEIRAGEDRIELYKEEIDFINENYDKLTVTINENIKETVYKVTIPDDGYLQWFDNIDEKTMEEFYAKLKEKEGKKKLNKVKKEIEKFVKEELMEDEYLHFNSFYLITKDIIGDKDVSLLFNDIGYKGIQYPINATSSHPSKTKSNFVIFDENNVKIEETVSGKENIMLFQAMSEEELNEKAIEEAMLIEDFDTFEVIYKATHPDFVDKTGTWLKDKFEQAKQRAGLENVEHIYKSAPTDNSKNIIFKKSLENNEMSNLFIRKAKEFKRRIERVRGKTLTSDIFQINARLLEEIETLFANTEVMSEGKINSINREALRKVVEENPSQARIIFAKLNGLDYMMSDYEYDNSDYFEVFVNNYDSKDNVLSGAILTSTNEEVRQKMKADYKLFLENKNAQAKNLKTLLENVRKQRDLSVAKSKGLSAEVERLNAKYKEDVARILKEYKTKIKDLEEGIEVERTSREISEYKVNDSVRNDSARDLYAFKSLLNVKDRNNFRTAEGEPWSAIYVHNLIRDYLGEYYASLFTAKMIEENMKKPNTQQGFVSEELKVLLAVMDNIKKDGIKKRNADMLAVNTRIENNIRQLQIATQVSLEKFKEGKLYKAIDKLPNSDKITPIISGIFTGTFNITRKAMLLDGLDVGKDGAWYKLLVDRRRAIKDLETLTVDRRKSALNDILKKYDLNPIKLSKTVLETEFGGFKQKHSAVDLGYYYISQFNDDNKIAVAGGHLMTAEERLSETMTHDEFEEEAFRRYNIVLAEATKLYKENEAYHELFDAIIKEFNGEVMQKMNMLMMKTRNKQSQAIKNYLAIQRKGETTTEVLAQFEIDIDENDRYDNIDSTAFGALRERKKIDIRKQTDINTDIFDLISKTIDKQEHLLANYEYVYELKQTFTSVKSVQLKEAVTNGYGKGIYKDIITFIEEVANPYANKHDTALDKLVKPLKGNIYPAFLGARTPVIIMQMITSPAAFMGKMNVFQYLGSFMHTLTNRGEVVSKVNELSPFMKNRSWDYAWSDSWTARHKGDKMTHNELVKEHVLEKLMGGLKWADQTTVYSGWNEMFEQELNRLGLSTDENIKKAVKYADDFVRNTQPLSDVTEIAPLFKSGEAGKLFTQFTASLSPIYQNVFFDTVALKKQGNGKEAVGMMVGYAMVGALLFAARGGYEKDDDAEEVFKKLIASSLSQPVSSLPLIGSVAEYLVKYAITGDSSGLYSTSKFPMFDKLTSGATKFIAGDYAKGFSLALDGIMIGTGLPVGFKTDVEKAIEEMRDDKLPLSFIGYDR